MHSRISRKRSMNYILSRKNMEIFPWAKFLRKRKQKHKNILLIQEKILTWVQGNYRVSWACELSNNSWYVQISIRRMDSIWKDSFKRTWIMEMENRTVLPMEDKTDLWISRFKMDHVHSVKTCRLKVLRSISKFKTKWSDEKGHRCLILATTKWNSWY